MFLWAALSVFGWVGRTTEAGRDAAAHKDNTHPSSTRDWRGHFAVSSRVLKVGGVGNKSHTQDTSGRFCALSGTGFRGGRIVGSHVQRRGPGLRQLDYLR